MKQTSLFKLLALLLALALAAAACGGDDDGDDGVDAGGDDMADDAVDDVPGENEARPCGFARGVEFWQRDAFTQMEEGG